MGRLSRILLTLCLLTPGTARAQGAINRIFPNGAQRGTKVKLTLGGSGIPAKATLVVEGDGIRPLGEFVKGVGEVEIASDARPGFRQLRLVGPRSATSPRPFAVGLFPDVNEREPNDRATDAQPLAALPVTLNGSLPSRPDIDVFRVHLRQGECLVVASESRALGAPTDLIVRIRDLQRRELAVQMDYRTRDPLLGFVAPQTADYLVELQDVMNNYSGINSDYVYRVHLTTGPWLDYVSPPSAQRGAAAALTFHGWNLGGKAGPGAVTETVVIPAGAAERFPITGGGAPNPALLQVADLTTVAEQGGTSPQSLATPMSVNGTFSRPGERDRYRFHAAAGQMLLLDVQARTLGSFADPVLTLLDASGKQLSRIDDVGGSRDPQLLWKAPAAGEYAVVLEDVAAGARGGENFFYRFSVAPPPPRLSLTTTLYTPVLKPSGKLEIPVTVSQSFQPAEVRLTVEGLPAGVTAAAVNVKPSPGKRTNATVKLILTATKDAPPGHAVIRIAARTAGASSLIASAMAKWVLSTDRSGTLAEGSTSRLLLLIAAPSPPSEKK